MEKGNSPVMVTIQCITFNQEAYIRDCLDGFVMQKTNFKFEAIVHDDASTDGTVAIIREYAEKYPDIIRPIYEVENQYSKHDGSLQRIVDEQTCGKYVACCEGDDYWTDPLKLQKQFDFMEQHKNCVLCQHAAQMLYPDGSIKENRRFNETLDKCLPDQIIKGGAGITCSNFFRAELLRIQPEWRIKAPVGDLPLVLVALNVGDVGYINDIMSCYRVASIGSWTNRKGRGLKKNLEHYQKMIEMYKGYNEWSNKKYDSSIRKKIRNLKKTRILHILSSLKRSVF